MLGCGDLGYVLPEWSLQASVALDAVFAVVFSAKAFFFISAWM